ncbi:GDSL-type esterase/lipase family protein [Gordonia sihwensis]|uniref:GDSL-type esterase/lipase family protein n=1 Tax=Gordonia TaxID=2053 RepID=UPI0024173401|nr:GDSL-type esterase/lipase family protein [Gordonia sihwensis]WFN92420.1 GDSL-type esterase/lipase family protein [Gordonia sihwensis]
MARWIRLSIALVAVMTGLSLVPAVGYADTGGRHWVGSWMAAPTDALNGADADLVPILNIADQTFRVVVTPHMGGDEVRVRLTNAARPVPLDVSAATVAIAGPGAAVASPVVPLTFHGKRAVVIPAGGDVLSDPVHLDVDAWQRLAVSVSVRGPAAFVTQHMNGNATSYYTVPGAGDRTRSRRAADFPLSTTVVPIVNRVDVLASPQTSAIVTLGDSITDGYVADNYLVVPQSRRGVVDRNVRYPDFLQRRLDAAGMSRSVVNAGISGNRVVSDGLVPEFGTAAIDRLHRDVLSVPGVKDVILLEGINDLAMPVGSTADQVIAGYKNIIARLKADGVRVHVATILPASDSLFSGYAAPRADSERQRVNHWIRTQKLADSVIDLDRAVRDEHDPSVLAPKYSGPDRLHPNPAGYRTMAEAVDLSIFS